MPKLKDQLPKKCRDRNRCFSWYKGKRIYHGVWGSPEADRNYKRFIARLLENPDLPLQDSKTGDSLVSELAADFLKYAGTRFEKTEFQHFQRAIGFWVAVYGELAVNKFSPKKLKVCRSQMMKAGTLCRSQIIVLPTKFALVRCIACLADNQKNHYFVRIILILSAWQAAGEADQNLLSHR